MIPSPKQWSRLRITTHCHNSSKMNKKPGANAPGAGAPSLLLAEVAPGAFAPDAPGAGASSDSFTRVSSVTVASDAPGLHRLTAPALSNRPLYQSCSAEPPLDANFDTKLVSLFLQYL